MAHTESRYEAARRAACPHCALSCPRIYRGGRKDTRHHYVSGNWEPCTAPTLESWAEEQAEIAELAVRALFCEDHWFAAEKDGDRVALFTQRDIIGSSSTLLDALRDAEAKGYLPEVPK